MALVDHVTSCHGRQVAVDIRALENRCSVSLRTRKRPQSHTGNSRNTGWLEREPAKYRILDVCRVRLGNMGPLKCTGHKD